MRPNLPETHRQHFDIQLPSGKIWFSPVEVAALIGRSDQFVRSAFENQKILGHTTNARAPRGKERRRAYQIHRDAVVLFLLETANYEPTDFLQRLCDLIHHRPAGDLKLIQKQVTRRLESLGL